MKHLNKVSVSLLSLLLVLSGCGNNTSNDSGSKITDTTGMTHKLAIASASKIEFYQYDQFNYSNLVVNEELYDAKGNFKSRSAITDYSVYIGDEEIKDGGRLNTTGNLFLSVVKEGCGSAELTIYVNEINSLTQTITIESYPNKMSYVIGESFTSEGFKAKLKVVYVGKTRKTSIVDLEDYELSIDGEEAEGYTLTEFGYKTVTVKTSGWDGSEVTASFRISAIPENNVTTPKQYADDSISFVSNSSTMTIKFENDSKTTVPGDKGYYSPNEVVNAYNITEYTKRNMYDWHYTPSTGKVPLLIIPVVTPGDEDKATEANWNLINKAFFGDSKDLNFESLHSYYYKSSHGKLDITGGVTGYFDPSLYDSQFSTINGYTLSSTATLPELALDWAVEQYGIDLDDYDSNGDGCVDGLWLINLHQASNSGSGVFWAYTTTTTNEMTGTTPVVNTFGWASIDFINDQFAVNSYGPGKYSDAACDAHVLIHETGHMLGLSDYYAYSNSTNNYSPLGRVDMMDYNCSDHNAYSKLIFGWTNPYIVYGNATISIPVSQMEDAVIVVANDDKTYKKNSDGKVIFNAYDEYLAMEYYTDDGMNSQGYDCYYTDNIIGSGLKLYHVDARLAKYDSSNISAPFSLYDDPDTPFESGNNDVFYRCISNSNGNSSLAESNFDGMPADSSDYDEIRLISADKTMLDAVNAANNSSLFKNGATFDMKTYSNQFNNGMFDNKKTFSYTISITDIK